MSNYTSNLTGCPDCGVIYIDAIVCQNCFLQLTPEQVWEIQNSLLNHGGHLFAKIINSVLRPPEVEVSIEYGAICRKCRELYPHAVKSGSFECWACRNNF